MMISDIIATGIVSVLVLLMRSNSFSSGWILHPSSSTKLCTHSYNNWRSCSQKTKSITTTKTKTTAVGKRLNLQPSIRAKSSIIHSSAATDEERIENISDSASSKSLEKIKSSLLRLALVSGRGVWSRTEESSDVAQLLKELEKIYYEQQQQHSSSSSPMIIKDGTWELVYSDVEPFRASVFFLALAEAVEANIKRDASDGALTVHSLATGGGEIGRVAHVIEGNATRLHSLVELKSGSLPSLPLALTGTVISSGELSAASTNKFYLELKNTTVQESKVKYGLPSNDGLQPGEEPNMLSWIGKQLVPSGEIFSSVLDPIGGGQTALLKLSYADDDFIVWRTPRLLSGSSLSLSDDIDDGFDNNNQNDDNNGRRGGQHFFCFVRGDERNWPAMNELRENQNKQSAVQSPIGSAFAFGMLNPFFTRRAGIKQ